MNRLTATLSFKKGEEDKLAKMFKVAISGHRNAQHSNFYVPAKTTVAPLRRFIPEGKWAHCQVFSLMVFLH